MESKTVTPRTPRRRHARELKAEVLAACAEPGASVAAVSLRYGLNANLVHKWRRGQARSSVAVSAVAGEFVALRPPMPLALTATTAPDIRVELRRGATTVTVHWPVAAAGECVGWLGQWLK